MAEINGHGSSSNSSSPPQREKEREREHMLIALMGSKPEAFIKRMNESFPHIDVDFYPVKATDNFVDVVKLGEGVPRELWEKATIVVTLFALPPSVEMVPNLKYIHLFSAGIDHFTTHPTFQTLTSTQPTSHTAVKITTSTGIAAPPIAEHIIMTLLALSNRLPKQLTWQTQRHWGPKAPFMASTGDWLGKRVGIAGYGSIGRHTGRILVALGAEIYAYTHEPRDTAESRRDTKFCLPGTGDPEGKWPARWFHGTTKASFREFLGQRLHALVVCVPLTDRTRHLLGAEELALLQSTSPYARSSFDADAEGSSPAGAFIVNISRGAVIDQAAMTDALKRRVIRGAALDVTDPEPLPMDSELWGLENCIITPHTSALGMEYAGRGFEVLVENLGRMGREEELCNLVGRGKGY